MLNYIYIILNVIIYLYLETSKDSDKLYEFF